MTVAQFSVEHNFDSCTGSASWPPFFRSGCSVCACEMAGVGISNLCIKRVDSSRDDHPTLSCSQNRIQVAKACFSSLLDFSSCRPSTSYSIHAERRQIPRWLGWCFGVLHLRGLARFGENGTCTGTRQEIFQGYHGREGGLTHFDRLPLLVRGESLRGASSPRDDARILGLGNYRVSTN